MSYPNDIDTFTDKLNKRDKAYVIEEEVEVINGVYEDLLNHDNIVDSSVSVWTGSKLTGDKVANFILSIPSATPWKRLIKVFSSVSPVFITYETFGDQVEADDINQLQSSMTATQTEVDRYKAANDLVVTNTVNRVTTLENKKADKTYVDSELLKKADKATTYTKSETDARIQAVVDAAPEALDTLNEIAAALNDDPNFAGTMTTELSKKVDKVVGKQLSTEDYLTAEKAKLANVEANANKYIHPSTHPATMIVEDSAHRFATDAEKTAWNAKETTTGAQDKVDAHSNDEVKHITPEERIAWDAKSNLTLGETASNAYRGDRGKIAYDHSQATHAPANAQRNSDITKAEIEAKLIGDITTHTHSQYVTQADLGNAGYGDMTKAIYDTNGNGKVDAAESVPWSGVTGKPSTFAPTAHTHDVLKNKADNWRDELSLPSTYDVGETIFFSNLPANKFNGASYCTVHTIRGYGGFANCIQYIYPYNADAPITYRYSIYNSDTWKEWRKISIEGHTHTISNIAGLQSELNSKMKKGPLTWNDLKGV